MNFLKQNGSKINQLLLLYFFIPKQSLLMSSSRYRDSVPTAEKRTNRVPPKALAVAQKNRRRRKS
jgi:hypothetical protein